MGETGRRFEVSLEITPSAEGDALNLYVGPSEASAEAALSWTASVVEKANRLVAEASENGERMDELARNWVEKAVNSFSSGCPEPASSPLNGAPNPRSLLQRGVPRHPGLNPRKTSKPNPAPSRIRALCPWWTGGTSVTARLHS